MKNKVYLIALLLSLAMTTMLTSCSNNNPEKLIVGDWGLVMISTHYIEGSDDYGTDYDREVGYGSPAYCTLKFTDDGRCFFGGREVCTYYVTENYINFSRSVADIGSGDVEYDLTRNRLSFVKYDSYRGNRWSETYKFNRI